MNETPSNSDESRPAVGGPVQRQVRRPNPTRSDFEAWAAKRWGVDAHRHTSGTCGEWDAWKGGMAALADTVQPAAWVFEWGAIDLPRGDPSRITCMSAHPTEAEALAQADGCECNWQVYPAYCIGDGRTPNVEINRHCPAPEER